MAERLTDAEREALGRIWDEALDGTGWYPGKSARVEYVVRRALAAVPRLASSADAAPGAERRDVCVWWYMDWPASDSDFEGDCGIAWSMNDGGLAHNGVVFCPRCGGRIDFVPPEDDEDVNDATD